MKSPNAQFSTSAMRLFALLQRLPRDLCAGVFFLVFSLWAVFGAGGLVAALGYVAVLPAVFLLWSGVQRARFERRENTGLGSVDVDEGQITYFGPLTGGMIALSDLTSVSLMAGAGQSPHWQLSGTPQSLFIPVDAAGSDALFDAFAVLPGFRRERMVTALSQSENGTVVIWRRPGAGPSHGAGGLAISSDSRARLSQGPSL